LFGLALEVNGYELSMIDNRCRMVERREMLQPWGANGVESYISITAHFLVDSSVGVIVEKTERARMEDYAKLASLMSTDPGFAICRRFGALNTQEVVILTSGTSDSRERP